LDLEPGTVVANRYRISRPLGRGGMGEVFAAENIRTGRPVAIKLLRQDSKQKSSAVARFRQEARAAGSINSDHVTQVLDVEEDPEHGVVLVFELLEGESLIERLKRTGPLSFEELWPIIEQVWMGLADAHRAGIIHRDLKPSNVFLERRPDGVMRVKILDFGISKVPKEAGGETLTEMGQSLGTFSFMPPEQIGKAKTVDHRADIYAAATLIYQSLTGQLPYAARNILIMVEMKTKTDARSLAEAMQAPVDPRLEAFVACGLSREPARRFPTALDALEQWRELRALSPSLSPSFSSGGPPTSAAGPRSHNTSPRTEVGIAPRAPSPPLIQEAPAGLPRMDGDVADMTTDEGAATLAMPMPHLKKAVSAQVTPPLAPRVDSATASIGGLALSPIASLSPSSLAAMGAPSSSPMRQMTQAGPSGTAFAPVSRAAPVEAARPGVPLAPHAAPHSGPRSAPQAMPPIAPELPRTFDDPSSQSSEARTSLYRPALPRGAIAGPATPTSATVTGPRPGRRSRVPLVLFLLGFLLVGFFAVAGVMVLLTR
jgi:serine/threonine-protein kinase